MQQSVPARESSVAKQAVKSQAHGEINTLLNFQFSPSKSSLMLNPPLSQAKMRQATSTPPQVATTPNFSTTFQFSPSKSSLMLNQKVENQKGERSVTILIISILVTTQEGTRTEGEQGSQSKSLQAKEGEHDLACASWKYSHGCDKRTASPMDCESSRTPFAGL
jgi:hypothetical protein